MFKNAITFSVAMLCMVKAIEDGEEIFDDTIEEDFSLGDALAAASSKGPEDRGYFRGDHYRYQLTAQEKLDELWPILVPDQNDDSVEPRAFQFNEFDKFFQQRSAGTFCNNTDETRNKRPKSTHTQGIVAQAEWKAVEGVDLSGIYGAGSTVNTIIRLSETKALTEKSMGLHPSMAIKFLVDNEKSMNLFGMPNFEGTKSWDFFSMPLKSRVDRFEDTCHRETRELKMLEGNNRPYATSVIKPAIQLQDGTCEFPDCKPPRNDTSSSFKFPFQLEYEGYAYYKEGTETSEYDINDPDTYWYNQMKDHYNTLFDQDLDGDSIADGNVKLMKVFSWDAPPKEPGAQRTHIADIVLKTKLYTSEAGDERLFFQHDRVNKDRRRWPRAWKNFDFEGPRQEISWAGIDDWKTDEAEARNDYIEYHDATQHACPFAWLLPFSYVNEPEEEETVVLSNP